ncbi:unnamed protein product [Tuber melanosporum]|uniref:(Perigord truffle) hypothetical protein n=1 Tax=Tuber melanosporum (strain Mel28) TaxID=656061 RepID=D5GN80_TUBMM|nr:uncharacterized protein GSTUM_00011142001 [Tuber melanosporum]CAZ85973.1 unnamed protein product [Tuber melanosporum]
MGAIVTPPPHPDLVKRATANFYCTGVMADVQCPSVRGFKGNCVVVSSTGQCCYETNIARCARGGDCRDFTAGCGTACCTEAFPYCNTEVVPNDAVYPHCEQTSNPTYTNSYYLNGNTPGIGVLTSRRSDLGLTGTTKPGSSPSIVTVTHSTAPPSATTSRGTDSEPMSGGAIAGIAIGGAAGLGALALGVFFLFFKKKPTAPAQSGGMAEYTQQQHLQQYVPQPIQSPGFAHGHDDPSTPKPYPEQQLAEAPANETPIVGYRPAWELPASNH